MDANASKALEAMLREYNENSVIFESFLSHIKSRYYISIEYDLHVSTIAQWPFDPFLNGFGLSVDVLEVGLRLPLHSLVVSWLRQWKAPRLEPSQPSTNIAVVVSATYRADPQPRRPRCWCGWTEPTPNCSVRGVLCPSFVKEIYATPSEALLDNAAKNLAIVKNVLGRLRVRYGITLACFRVRYPQLEIKDDLYATLPEVTICR
ncbi:hypothetical protein GW17_00008702 [Ensete ventricosum]|nr:hypothetical protein GW17_00008702 [Ensete ventricosum]